MKNTNTSIIVACSTEYGIGYDNKMCWHIPEELQNFRKVTTEVTDKTKKNCVVMGKNTWYSLPNGALKNRVNIVLSTQLHSTHDDEMICMKSLDDAFAYIGGRDDIESTFIIGGAQLYNECLKNQKYLQKIDKIYFTIVYDKNYVCDKFIDADCIYRNFHFEKENIHFTERYVFMIGHNKMHTGMNSITS